MSYKVLYGLIRGIIRYYSGVHEQTGDTHINMRSTGQSLIHPSSSRKLAVVESESLRHSSKMHGGTTAAPKRETLCTNKRGDAGLSCKVEGRFLLCCNLY